MDQPTQESPGGDDDSRGGQFASAGKTNTRDAAVSNDQLVGLTFDHGEVGSFADRSLHGRGIELAIRLGARPPHGRALAPIEHAKLNACGVGDPAHQTIERIHFPDQVTFAQPSDRRIAGHGANGGETMGQQRRPCADPSGSAGGLATRVTSSDDDDVERLT